MKATRESTGYLKISIGDGTRIILNSNRPIDEEVFASLKYYSEVKKVGLGFIKKLGHENPIDVWLQFRAFIRQAETFFQSANQLNYRASALMYYYGFLNLAKGFICLSDPAFVMQPVSHGIRHKFTKGRFSSQFITTDSNGVFPKLYELALGKKIPAQSKLNIVKLLGYCTDISYEYSLSKLGERQHRPALIRLFVDNHTKTSWSTIAISNFNTNSSYMPLKKKNGAFEEVSLSIEEAKRAFDISPEVYRNFSFFETKKIYPWIENRLPVPQVISETRIALREYYEANPYDSEFSLIFFSPLNKNTTFNQTLSIYATMFYLGSLVRYRPDYLESLLDSKEAWIIERFTKSASLTYLRSITNYILQKDLVFTQR